MAQMLTVATTEIGRSFGLARSPSSGRAKPLHPWALWVATVITFHMETGRTVDGE